MFKLLVIVLGWSAVGLIGVILFLGEISRQNRIDTACYYYTRNGTPMSIAVEGTEYKLLPDGSMDPIDRVFLNPWHEEMLRAMEDEDCIVINTRGGRR